MKAIDTKHKVCGFDESKCSENISRMVSSSIPLFLFPVQEGGYNGGNVKIHWDVASYGRQGDKL